MFTGKVETVIGDNPNLEHQFSCCDYVRRLRGPSGNSCLATVIPDRRLGAIPGGTTNRMPVSQPGSTPRTLVPNLVRSHLGSSAVSLPISEVLAGASHPLFLAATSPVAQLETVTWISANTATLPLLSVTLTFKVCGPLPYFVVSKE